MSPSVSGSVSGSGVPSVSPSDVSWAAVGVLVVPVSASAGPFDRSGPVWGCYARTVMGAVIAAHVVAAQLATRDWRRVVAASVVDDAGRAAFVRASAHQRFRPLSPSQVAQPVGWQVVSYTPGQQATVEALAATGEGSFQVVTRTVVWDHGDWKLRMTPDGAAGTDPQTLATTTGFTRWPHA